MTGKVRSKISVVVASVAHLQEDGKQITLHDGTSAAGISNQHGVPTGGAFHFWASEAFSDMSFC